MSDYSKKIYLSPPHLGDQEIEFVKDAFESNWIAPCGPHQEEFENELANYIGIKGALAVSSGTAAIHLALRLLDVGQGDVVFCSSFTFIGSATPILFQGAEPVFIDSDPETWNLSTNALERAFEKAKKINRMPKAVIVVNLYGQSADFDKLKEICDKFQTPIIEDAAESLGATYKGKSSGSLGEFGIFSFNGNKIITTSGGGMLISNDTKALEKARYWSTQARDPVLHYEHSELGYNYRMSNVLAAIGCGQLKLLDQRVQKRREIFQIYYEAFKNTPGVGFMPEASFGKSTRWLTVMTINSKICNSSSQEVIQSLINQNIEARPVWKPLHLQPVFNNVSYFANRPNESFSEEIYDRGICLPSGTNMSNEDQKKIIEIIKTSLAQ